ncbi:hypothetical protein EOD41_00130 [Mucilaginibacter limnophilus]|uniref:Integron Cassette Protein Hfx-Cass5 domain-containing protein n=1 Tax=Mucilaginibacter limnophilus TaxID=1932778 RepID=A0A3S2UMZ1_9SPHI|nr:hypothetical protein EOD41_00130 [Mucilaginibacter limnophilus]
MDIDHIEAIGINEQGQLYVKPCKKQFTLIWRSATQVHWNDTGSYLYSPKPTEWSYMDWYKHIVTVIADEYNCKLLVVNDTLWYSVDNELKGQIINFNSEL